MGHNKTKQTRITGNKILSPSRRNNREDRLNLRIDVYKESELIMVPQEDTLTKVVHQYHVYNGWE